jgi:hypothetical protein
LNSSSSIENTGHKCDMKFMDPPNRDEAAQIAEFLHSQTPLPRQSARLGMTAFKLCDNETHTGFASVMMVGEVSEVVSVCTITPKRLWHRGRETLWAEIGDTFTSDAYLRKGMFGDLVNATRSRAESSGFKIIYGLPNDQSLPGYLKKLNFILNTNIRLNDYFLLLNTLPLQRYPGVNRIPALGTLLASKTSVKLSGYLIKLFAIQTKLRVKGFQIDKIDSFSDEFDDLWKSVRSKLSNAQIRDSKYLRWRYGCSPFGFEVIAARRSGRLCGYIVTLTLKEDQKQGLVHTVIVDWLFDPAELGVSKLLLSSVVDIAYSKGADLISARISDSTPIDLPFSRLGFIRRFSPHPLIVFANQEGREFCEEASPWHFTMSDTDAF